jgi:mono/diheme cytochrome c family protein
MRPRALRIGIPAALAGLALLLGACGGGDSSDGDATTAPTEAPTTVATEAPDDGDLFDGKTAAEFYSISCAACHGADRQGIVGPGLTPDLLVEDDDFYVKTILDGRPATAMPAWSASGVSEAEAAALVAFFRTAP